MNGCRAPAYTRSAPLRNASSTSACPMPRLPPVTRTDLPVIAVPFISSSFGFTLSSAISIALCDNRDPLGRQNPSRGLQRDADDAQRPRTRRRYARLTRSRRTSTALQSPYDHSSRALDARRSVALRPLAPRPFAPRALGRLLPRPALGITELLGDR